MNPVQSGERMKRKMKFEKQLEYLEKYQKSRMITLKEIVALHQHSNEELSKETSLKLNLSTDFIEWFFYQQRNVARELLKKNRRERKNEEKKMRD